MSAMIANKRTMLSFLLVLFECLFVTAMGARSSERYLGIGYMSMDGKGSSKGASSKGISSKGVSSKGVSSKGVSTKAPSAKSKSKGVKSTKASKGDVDDDYLMSMSFDYSEGKGSVKSVKDSSKGKGKGTKESKSTKKEAKSAKAKGKGDVAPSAAPYAPTGPTATPVAPTPTTPSPTSASSIPIRATPYALFYTGDFSRIPEDAEFAEVAELTRVYLEEFMVNEFSQTSLTNLDDFLSVMIRNVFAFDEPVQTDYRSTGLFNPSSIFLPTVRELDELLDEAFVDENMELYLERVRALPSSNIFSTTTTVSKGLPDVPVSRTPDSTSTSSAFRYEIIGAAAGLVVLAAGAAFFRRQRSKARNGASLPNPYSDNLKGDAATIAGETCTTSLDDASAAALWRKSSPYITSNELNQDDVFEDEPLDSDDDDDEDEDEEDDDQDNTIDARLGSRDEQEDELSRQSMTLNSMSALSS